MPKEIEIKFRVHDLAALNRNLRAAGFRIITRRTHEMNTLYDLPGDVLRRRKELLRIRKYGAEWTLTHKSGAIRGRHSSRTELETKVADGKTLDTILRALGYAPRFRYEKFRAEWVDEKSDTSSAKRIDKNSPIHEKRKTSKGVVVVDETPIGNFCEIEGSPRWIDATAEKLGVIPKDYITKNYATLFEEWKKATQSTAREMTYSAILG
jgi:adenylate cyclase, class 2